MHLGLGSAQWKYVSGDILPCLAHNPRSTQSIHQNETHSQEDRASLHNMIFPLLSCVTPVVKYSAVLTLKLSSGFRVNIPLRLLGRFVLLSEKFKAVCRLRQTALNGSLLARYRNVIFVTTIIFFSINATNWPNLTPDSGLVAWKSQWVSWKLKWILRKLVKMYFFAEWPPHPGQRGHSAHTSTSKSLLSQAFQISAEMQF